MTPANTPSFRDQLGQSSVSVVPVPRDRVPRRHRNLACLARSAHRPITAKLEEILAEPGLMRGAACSWRRMVLTSAKTHADRLAHQAHAKRRGFAALETVYGRRRKHWMLTSSRKSWSISKTFRRWRFNHVRRLRALSPEARNRRHVGRLLLAQDARGRNFSELWKLRTEL